MSNESPNKGVWISKEILAMKDLSIGEKLVLAHMTTFPDFFARDSTLAANLHMNQRTVERLIAGLRAKGHIKGKWRTRKPTTQKCVVNYAKTSSPTTRKCVDNIKENNKVIPYREPSAPKPGENNDQYLNRLLRQAGFSP